MDLGTEKDPDWTHLKSNSCSVHCTACGLTLTVLFGQPNVHHTRRGAYRMHRDRTVKAKIRGNASNTMKLTT